MSSKSDIKTFGMSFPLSTVPTPRQRYRRRRKIIKPTRRLSTIDEIEVHSSSSSDSSNPDKNIVTKRPALGNGIEKILFIRRILKYLNHVCKISLISDLPVIFQREIYKNEVTLFVKS